MEEKEGKKHNEQTIVLEVKPLRLNQQIETPHADSLSKREEKDGNVTKLSGKQVPEKDFKHPESKEKSKECTKKNSLKSISKQEAPKQIIRSKGHDDENVQMKFMKTTYEDPVQCNDINRIDDHCLSVGVLARGMWRAFLRAAAYRLAPPKSRTQARSPRRVG